MALFNRKERRGDRAAEISPNVFIRPALRMALIKISNMTRREMPDDDEFRLWAQNLAHKALITEVLEKGIGKVSVIKPKVKKWRWVFRRDTEAEHDLRITSRHLSDIDVLVSGGKLIFIEKLHSTEIEE